MALNHAGTGAAGVRYLGMDKLETSVTLHQIADRMRQQAAQTNLPEYQQMMLRTADSLETEANRLFDLSFRMLMERSGPLH